VAVAVVGIVLLDKQADLAVEQQDTLVELLVLAPPDKDLLAVTE
jgi:hypothetical protein